VLPEISEHLNQGISHLARRGERAAVPALGKQRPAARQKVVHLASDTDHEPAHATRQSALVPRFDQQVDMVALDGEVNHTKPSRFTLSSAQNREAHRREDMLAAERCET
jgi:hypothetical protein